MALIWTHCGKISRQAGSHSHCVSAEQTKVRLGEGSTFLQGALPEVQEHGHHLLSESFLQNKGLGYIWVALDTGKED